VSHRSLTRLPERWPRKTSYVAKLLNNLATVLKDQDKLAEAETRHRGSSTEICQRGRKSVWAETGGRTT